MDKRRAEENIWSQKGENKGRNEKNYIIRSLIIHTLHQILLE
jgi:hypothetical protein